MSARLRVVLKKNAWPGLPQVPRCLDGGPLPIHLADHSDDRHSRFLDTILPRACLRSSFPFPVLPVLVRRAFQVFLFPPCGGLSSSLSSLPIYRVHTWTNAAACPPFLTPSPPLSPSNQPSPAQPTAHSPGLRRASHRGCERTCSGQYSRNQPTDLDPNLKDDDTNTIDTLHSLHSRMRRWASSCTTTCVPLPTTTARQLESGS